MFIAIKLEVFLCFLGSESFSGYSCHHLTTVRAVVPATVVASAKLLMLIDTEVWDV